MGIVVENAETKKIFFYVKGADVIMKKMVNILKYYRKYKVIFN